VGDDLVQQALALMGAADRKAPQGVAEAAARADDIVLLIEHGTDVRFIAENLSPGGSADLLALTYLLHFITTEGNNDE